MCVFSHLVGDVMCVLSCRKSHDMCIPSADQVYGDQEMHSAARNLCMDYMVRGRSGSMSGVGGGVGVRVVRGGGVGV